MKNAIVTGSNRGMGKAIVEKLVSNGINVWACARKPSEEFERFLSELSQKYEADAEPLYFSMNSEAEIKTGFKQIFQSKKDIDILVNNAGIATVGTFEMISYEKMLETFQVNIFGPMILTKYVLKRMKPQNKGVIINISSISGLDKLSGNSVYGASKAALIGFTQCLSAELGSYGIRVNSVAPGSTDTEMLSFFQAMTDEPLENRSILKKLVSPTDIANLVYFLSSDEANFINGQVIRIDGGI